MHYPIHLKHISLFFPQRTCFADFSAKINPGDRIAIIGRNGMGKSSLLKIIQGKLTPSEGDVKIPENLVFGSVPQVVTQYDDLSGGQRFNKALTQALAQQPDVLCLDEPTNHLDAKNRRSLMRLIAHYNGTFVVVTHDPSLTRLCNQIWHIEHETISIVHGNYDDYLNEHKTKMHAQQKKLEQLKKEKSKNQKAIELEKKRAAQSKKSNRSENDTNLRRKMQETGSKTTGKKNRNINKLNQNITQALQELHISKTINPKFNLDSADLSSNKSIIDIKNGTCGYAHKPIVSNIHLQLNPTERIVICGDNGSGKSTLIKAIIQHPDIVRSDTWHTPKPADIGYLDQHNNNLNMQHTVIQTIQEIAPHLTSPAIRKHLNDFLFQTNEQVHAQVKALSGGEKTRLSLAQIAAQNPKLLILDEVTNCLDLETREHVIQVVQNYPGAMIIISHDEDFLNRIDYDEMYTVADGNLQQNN